MPVTAEATVEEAGCALVVAAVLDVAAGCEVSLTTIRTTTTRTTAATAEPAIIRRRRRACARRCAARICAALCWDSRLFFDTPVTLHHPPVPSQLGPAIATSQRDRSESIAGDRSRAAL